MPEITPAEWNWLHYHPLWTVHNGSWYSCVTIDPMFVDPTDGNVDDDANKNTALHVWIEGGPNEIDDDDPSDCRADGPRIVRTHDYLLDAGGATLGEALAEFAANVRRVYGDGVERLVTS
jgi:hypothetical protein